MRKEKANLKWRYKNVNILGIDCQRTFLLPLPFFRLNMHNLCVPDCSITLLSVH